MKERRMEMGLPPDLKFKSALAKIRLANAFQTTVSASQGAKNYSINLPKIAKEKAEKAENDIKSVHDGVRICKSYGGFLWNEVGHWECTEKLPFITLQHKENLGSVPSRPAYFNKVKKVKVPAHLERFRFMRIKN